MSISCFFLLYLPVVSPLNICLFVCWINKTNTIKKYLKIFALLTKILTDLEWSQAIQEAVLLHKQASQSNDNFH